MKSLLLLSIAAALLITPVAHAVNWPDNRLNAAASAVAGHPTTVWCEDNWASWIHTGDSFRQDWSYLQGFTYISTPVIYIAPDQCETLHAMLNYEWIGTYHAASALLVLAHESVHQRGISDEGVTDCTALPLVTDLAVDYFEYDRTISEPYTATVRKHVGKRWVISHVVRYRQVESPWLKELAVDAMRWHKARPAQYQGNC